MKLQGFSVIFVLVCIPLLLVLSYYISLQVDTITLQNEYDSKLLSATYDAVSAFELNTANEDLSSVSDSLRTIIEASNSIFFNTLATNMGLSNASKAYIEPYIPSILYTLYDGYYIFAPTTIPVVKTDEEGVALTVGQDFVSYDDSTGYRYIPESDEEARNNWMGDILNANDLRDSASPEDFGQLLYISNDPEVSGEKLTTNPNEAKTQVKNVLKSYMPYSARYKAYGKLVDNSNLVYSSYANWNDRLTYDFNIIYTLDNFITVEGYVQNADNTDSQIYYTESGYLLKDSDGDSKTIIKLNNSEILDYNQNEIQNIIENCDSNGNIVTVEIEKVLNTDTMDKSVVEYSTESLEGIETIINAEAENHYVLVGDERPDPAEDNARINRLLFLTSNSDRWNEKSLKEKYEVLLTILKNRYTEIEEMSEESYIEDVGADVPRMAALNNINMFINRVQYNLDLMSSICYYAKAKMFTNWVTTHLAMIQANDIVEISGLDFGTLQEGLLIGTRDNYGDDIQSDFQTLINFKEDNTFLFNSDSFKANKSDSALYDDSATELGKDSIFNNHKLKVIRASIQYSLNLAMTTYNSNESFGLIAQSEIRKGNNRRINGYAMPVLQYEEWESITENPSIVSFMQGLRCGLKIYNNYAVVSSTNNELTVRPENVYYVAYSGTDYSEFNSGSLNDTDHYYHRINCQKIMNDVVDKNTKFASFASKEAKYDKFYDKMASKMKYKYDHKNLACYTCIIDGNYNDEKQNIFTIDSEHPDVEGKKEALRKAFYMALGKERNNIYKMNAFSNSYGYQRLYSKVNGVGRIYSDSGNCKLSQLKALKITFGFVSDVGENSITFKVKQGDRYLTDKNYSIPSNTAQLYTITVDNDNIREDDPASLATDIYDSLRFENADGSENTNLKNSVTLIEAIYR